MAPLNHTTPIDLSSFVLLDGDECQMKEITAKVIPAATPPTIVDKSHTDTQLKLSCAYLYTRSTLYS